MIAFIQTDISINTNIGNGKRFMAYAIIDSLIQKGAIELPDSLANRVEPGRKVKHKRHNVWELSFDWNICTTESFMKQKPDYNHKNPCSGKRSLASSPVEYGIVQPISIIPGINGFIRSLFQGSCIHGNKRNNGKTQRPLLWSGDLAEKGKRR